MTKRQRWRLAICLSVVLIGFGLGCTPATKTGLVPVTTKPDKQPDNKDKPGTQPKPDVG